MTLAYLTPLDEATQRAHGVTSPAPLAVADRVRFSELDALNHANNSVYMQWFERLRVIYSKSWGMSTYDTDAGNPRIVIRSGTIHYREEMRLDEDYIATCRCTAYRHTSYQLEQFIWSGGRIRASFECVMVLLEPDGSGARRPLPAAVVERFKTRDQARFDG